MKTSLLFTVLLFLSSIAFCQDITGTWNGILVVPGGQLRVDFHITAADNGYTATMDSPDQNAFGIPVKTTTFIKPDLTISMPDLGAEYKGKLTEKDLIKGTFKQNGQSFEMELKRKKE